MKLQLIEKSLTIASAIAAIVSAAIMCSQAIATTNFTPQAGPTPQSTQVTLEPCQK